jgi:hypothetical protein
MLLFLLEQPADNDMPLLKHCLFAGQDPSFYKTIAIIEQKLGGFPRHSAGMQSAQAAAQRYTSRNHQNSS